MALIDFELYWDSKNIASNVLDYSREHNICTGISLVSFSVPLTDDNDYTIWDEVIPYENGNKKGSFFISDLERNVPKGALTIRCQDGSKRLVDYFIPEMYEIQDGDYSGAWVETILNAAGVSYSIEAPGSGVILPAHTIGYDSAYGILMTLLQQSGWYMYFNTSNRAIIGSLDRDGAITDTLDTTEILSISREQSDKMLRNRALVYGNGVTVEEEVTTPWNYDADDDRTVVIASPYIRTEAVASDIASKLLNEFAVLSDEKEMEVTGFRNVTIGDRVMVRGSVFYGKGRVTTLVSKMSSGKGATTTLILDQRCPRLFTYYSPYYEGVGTYVYIGTWGNGVYRKPLWSSTWEEYNQGLTNSFIKDLYVKDGVLVCVADNGFAYRSNEVGNAWLRIWHGDFEDSDGVVHGEEEVDAIACSIDAFNNIIIGYNYSGIDNGIMNSWVYTITGAGVEISKEHVTTSGNSNYNIYDLDTYDSGRNVISCYPTTASGITFVTISGVDYPALGTTYNVGYSSKAQTETSVYNSDVYTALPVPETGNTVELNTDFNADTLATRIYEGSIYCSYGSEDGETLDNDLIYVESMAGDGLYLRHKKMTGAGLVDFYNLKIGGFTFTSELISLYYDGTNYYVIVSGSVFGAGSTFYHYAVEGGVSTQTVTDMGYTYPQTTGHVTKIGSKLYIYTHTDSSITLKIIDFVSGTIDSTQEETLEAGAVLTEISPIVPTNSGYMACGAYLIDIDGYSGCKGFTLINGTLTVELITTSAYPKGSSLIYGNETGGIVTTTTSNGSSLLACTGSFGNYDPGDGNVAFKSQFYLYVTLDGTMTGEVLEDIFPLGTPYAEQILDYGTSFSMINYTNTVPINSKYGDGMLAELVSGLVINFYNSERVLEGTVTLTDADAIGITGISPRTDDTDNSLAIRIQTSRGDTEVWGISYPTGTVNKKLIGLNVLGDSWSGTILERFHIVMNLIISEYGSYIRVTYLYNYSISEGYGGGASSILHHHDEVFDRVLSVSHLSRVEISRPNPTIVYNVASGILLSNLYYSFLNTSGSFTDLLGFNSIYGLRVFDANYSGGNGADESYSRYVGYTTPSGVYMLNTANMEGASNQIGFSGAPIQMEVANYGLNPYMFLSTSGPQQFYQRNPSAVDFTNMSINLPSGLITIIRLDDAL